MQPQAIPNCLLTNIEQRTRSYGRKKEKGLNRKDLYDYIIAEGNLSKEAFIILDTILDSKGLDPDINGINIYII